MIGENEFDNEYEITIVVKRRGKVNMNLSVEASSVEEGMDTIYEMTKWGVVKSTLLKKLKNELDEKVTSVKDFFDISKWINKLF